jgi:hypothetical protein
MILSDLKLLLDYYRGENDAGRTHLRILASRQRIMDIWELKSPIDMRLANEDDVDAWFNGFLPILDDFLAVTQDKKEVQQALQD